MFETKKQLKDINDRLDAIDGRIRTINSKITTLEINQSTFEASLKALPKPEMQHAKKSKKK